MLLGRIGLLLVVAVGSAHAQVELSEYARRRARVMEQLPDGIVLLHARSSSAELDQHHFRQAASFYYFTGLGNQPAAILALDATSGQSRLFVPPPPTGFGGEVSGVGVAAGPDAAKRFGFDAVSDWSEFDTYLDTQLESGTRVLYLDESRRPVPAGNPPSLAPMAGEHVLWRRAIEQRFPSAEIRSAAEAIRALRWVKSPAEVAILRRVAQASVAAALAGMRAVDVGTSQRLSEAAVVSGCITAGAEGPSFWPWAMSGPNAHADSLGRSFYDYQHLNRVMRAGELVRLDIGCDLEHYEGDVGRTVPVSGRFDEQQTEAWNLLITGYRAGLGAIRDGATRADLAAASRAAITGSPRPRSAYARRAATILRQSPDSMWHVHGVGVEAGEERVDPLREGAVIAYEPGFSVDADAYYLEDMILVTANGHEILSAGLPYTAEQIEAVMSSKELN